MNFTELYKLESLTSIADQLSAIVKLDAEHPIFKGHFPEHPVLPGVCMLDMITEVTGQFLNQSLRITASPLIKFLQMIDPQQNPLLHLEIKHERMGDLISTSGKIFHEKKIFMKFHLMLASDEQP